MDSEVPAVILYLMVFGLVAIIAACAAACAAAFPGLAVCAAAALILLGLQEGPGDHAAPAAAVVLLLLCGAAMPAGLRPPAFAQWIRAIAPELGLGAVTFGLLCLGAQENAADEIPPKAAILSAITLLTLLAIGGALALAPREGRPPAPAGVIHV